MIKENRLIGLFLEDINKARTKAGASTSNVVYNNRTASANATIQDTTSRLNSLTSQQKAIQEQRAALLEQHNSGEITTDEYNRANTLLTNAAHRIGAGIQAAGEGSAEAAQHLGTATSTYNNSAAGFGTSYDAKTGNTTIAGTGVIQQNAIDRIKAQHPEWTDAQVAAQVNEQQPGIQSTMSNSGQGMNYDGSGIAINGSEGSMFRNNPVKASNDAAKADTDARINSIQITKEIPDGKGGFITVLDSSATVKAREEARVAADTKAAADANYAASRTESDNASATPGSAGAASMEPPPPTNPDAFLAGLDVLEKQYAGNAMAPLFEFYKGQYSQLAAKGLRGTELMENIQKKTDEYVQQQKDSMGAMESAWNAMYDKILQSQLDSASRTYDQQTRLAKQQQQADQIEYDKAIRDQNIKNEEDRQALLLNNGVSGGWRSSQHTAKMISEFKKAENIIADLKTSKVSNSDAWSNKLIDIEQNFHTNITSAYDAHNMNILTLQDKLDARAQIIDKTVFDSEIGQMQAVNKLTDDWYDGLAAIAEGTTKTVIEIQQNALASAKDARTELTQQKTDFRNRYQFHLSTFGDTDSVGYGLLVKEASELGISIPSKAPTTLEQKAMVQKSIGDGISSERAATPHVFGGINFTPIAKNIISKLPARNQETAEKAVYEALESGDINLAMNALISAGLDGSGEGTRTEYRKASMGLAHTARALPLMLNTEQMNGWETFKNLKVNSLLLTEKDPEWLTALGAYQLAMGRTVTDLIGTAQTPGEADRLSGFAPSPYDTVQDAVIKLRNAHAYFQGNADAASSVALSLFYGNTVRNGQIVPVFGQNKPQEGSGYEDDPSLNGKQEPSNTQSSTGTFGSLMSSLVKASKSYESSYNGLSVVNAMSQKQSIGDWVASLGGKKSTGYDSDHVKLSLSDNHLHGGLDIAVPVDTPVKPLIGGKVVSVSGSAKDKSGWGLSITLEDNDGVFHKYSHLNSIPSYIKEAIDNGETPLISTDNVIAYSGNSGYSTGPHIDYRARRADGKWIRVEDTYAMAPNLI